MKIKSTFIAIIIILSIHSLFAQESPENQRFDVSLLYGIAFPGFNTFYFNVIGSPSLAIKPSFAIGAVIRYGPLASLYGSDLYSSIQFSYGQVGTDDLTLSQGSAQAGIQRLPVLLNITLKARSRLAPFVRIGAGACKTDFHESYTYPSGPSIRFNKWTFSYSIGGGINFQISKLIGIDLFTEAWITEPDLIEYVSPGIPRGIIGRYSIVVIGIQTWFLL